MNTKKSSPEILRQRAEEKLSASTSRRVPSRSASPHSEHELLKLIQEISFQNEEKAKRANELAVANIELAFQNEEKARRADELVIANKKLVFQNEEKEKRAGELSVAMADALKLTHELAVYKIELQLQNNELILATKNAKAAALKYSELYDFAPTGYFRLSKKGEILEINRCGYQMIGKKIFRSQNSMLGFFVSDESKPVFTDFLKRAFKRNIIENCEITLAARGDSPTYVHLSGIVKKNGNDLLMVMVDITERKQAEAALRQSETIHSSMISNISDVIGIIGVDGIMKYKSPNIEKRFGWKPNDLIGTDGWLTVHPEDLARIQKEFYTLLEKDNSVTTVEYRYKCKDGSYKPIELTAKNLTNDSTIGGVLLNYHDITQRRQMEEELKLVSVRLELAVRASGVGVWDYDIVNDILVWDDKMFALYGMTRKEFVGVYQTWQDGVHPDDKKRCDREIQMAKRGEKEFDTEFRVTWPDGSGHNIRALGVVQQEEVGKARNIIGTR